VASRTPPPKLSTARPFPSTALEFFEGLEGDCCLRKQPENRGDEIAGSPRFLTTHDYVHAPEEQMPMMRVYQSSSTQNQPFLDTTPLWSSKAPSPTPVPGRGGVSV
jgi:hypothetical protein